MPARKVYNKYHNRKTEYNGVLYDSKAEADYARELDRQLEVGLIFGWDRQLTYKLTVDDQLIAKYILDFRTHEGDGTCRHIDVKGLRTGPAWSVFRMKQKLMKAVHGIDVEVYPPAPPKKPRAPRKK